MIPTPKATKTKIHQLYLAGLSFTQIARAVNMTRGAVAGHCHRVGLCRELVKAEPGLERPQVAPLGPRTRAKRLDDVSAGAGPGVPWVLPRPISQRQREALADLRQAVENTK